MESLATVKLHQFYMYSQNTKQYPVTSTSKEHLWCPTEFINYSPLITKWIKMQGCQLTLKQFGEIFFTHCCLSFRLQIAALHFNENANKPQRKMKHGENEGSGQWLVSYPKYKKGGAVAREIKEACTYGNCTRLSTIHFVIKYNNYNAILDKTCGRLQLLLKVQLQSNNLSMKDL